MSKQENLQKVFNYFLDLYLMEAESYEDSPEISNYNLDQFKIFENILEGLISSGAEIKVDIRSIDYEFRTPEDHNLFKIDGYNCIDEDSPHYKFLTKHGVKVLLDE